MVSMASIKKNLVSTTEQFSTTSAGKYDAKDVYLYVDNNRLMLRTKSLWQRFTTTLKQLFGIEKAWGSWNGAQRSLAGKIAATAGLSVDEKTFVNAYATRIMGSRHASARTIAAWTNLTNVNTDTESFTESITSEESPIVETSAYDRLSEEMRTTVLDYQLQGKWEVAKRLIGQEVTSDDAIYRDETMLNSMLGKCAEINDVCGRSITDLIKTTKQNRDSLVRAHLVDQYDYLNEDVRGNYTNIRAIDESLRKVCDNTAELKDYRVAANFQLNRLTHEFRFESMRDVLIEEGLCNHAFSSKKIKDAKAEVLALITQYSGVVEKQFSSEFARDCMDTFVKKTFGSDTFDALRIGFPTAKIDDIPKNLKVIGQKALADLVTVEGRYYGRNFRKSGQFKQLSSQLKTCMLDAFKNRWGVVKSRVSQDYVERNSSQGSVSSSPRSSSGRWSPFSS